jgi:hypothetical protein
LGDDEAEVTMIKKDIRFEEPLSTVAEHCGIAQDETIEDTIGSISAVNTDGSPS